MTTPTHEPTPDIPATDITTRTSSSGDGPGHVPALAGERTTSTTSAGAGGQVVLGPAPESNEHPTQPQNTTLRTGTTGGKSEPEARCGLASGPGSYIWTPLHTPALARLIFNHPATGHLPPAALTDLLHTAGHDLAARARTHLNHRLTPAQTRDFLTVHDPGDPGPGTAWIQDNIPDQNTLLARLTARILDDITAGPYQYLNTHPTRPGQRLDG